MKQRSAGGQPLAVLSSLRLAVVTMVTLGSVCAFATFYEMRHGTPAVQRRHLPDALVRLPARAPRDEHRRRDGEPISLEEAPHRLPHRPRRHPHPSSPARSSRSIGGLDSNMAALRGRDRRPRDSPSRRPSRCRRRRAPAGSFPVVFEKRPPGPGHEQRFAVPGSDVVLVADDYQPHVIGAGERTRTAESGPRALHLVVQAPMATQDAWLVPDDPARSHLDLGLVSFGFHSAASEDEAQRLLAQGEGPNHLSLVLGPGGSLRYVATDAPGQAQTGTVETGQADRDGLAGPAASASTASCRPRSSARSCPRSRPPRKSGGGRRSACTSRARPAASEPEWVLWGEQRRSPPRRAQAPASAYRSPEQALPVPRHPAALQLRDVPGLAHGRHLRELGARGRSRAGPLRAPHLDEPPAPPPRLHLLPVVLRRRAAR